MIGPPFPLFLHHPKKWCPKEPTGHNDAGSHAPRPNGATPERVRNACATHVPGSRRRPLVCYICCLRVGPVTGRAWQRLDQQRRGKTDEVRDFWKRRQNQSKQTKCSPENYRNHMHTNHYTCLHVSTIINRHACIDLHDCCHRSWQRITSMFLRCEHPLICAGFLFQAVLLEQQPHLASAVVSEQMAQHNLHVF